MTLTAPPPAAAMDVPLLIVDSTPLIVLAKVRRLDLLTDRPAPAAGMPPLTRRILIPDAVAREVQAGDASDPARLALQSGWGMPVVAPSVPVALAALHLGAGEEAALACALNIPGAVVVCDDSAGRKAARELGLPLIGTLGVALPARRNGQVRLPLRRFCTLCIQRACSCLRIPCCNLCLRRWAKPGPEPCQRNSKRKSTR